jgi:hypothetical protein
VARLDIVKVEPVTEERARQQAAIRKYF